MATITPSNMVNHSDLEHLEPIPVWIANTIANFYSDRNGVINGTVKVLGVLQFKAQVSLYYRKNGQLIQNCFTDSNGGFSFQCGLNRSVSDYYAVAITDQPYNAQVFDKITPA